MRCCAFTPLAKVVALSDTFFLTLNADSLDQMGLGVFVTRDLKEWEQSGCVDDMGVKRLRRCCVAVMS
jgi:hypothetical protein